MERCDYDAAYLALRDAVGLAPNDATMRWALAECCYELTNNDEALETLENWQQLQGLTPQITAQIAGLLVMMGETRRAACAIEQLAAESTGEGARACGAGEHPGAPASAGRGPCDPTEFGTAGARSRNSDRLAAGVGATGRACRPAPAGTDPSDRSLAAASDACAQIPRIVSYGESARCAGPLRRGLRGSRGSAPLPDRLHRRCDGQGS